MRDYLLAHLSDHVLLRELGALAAQDRMTTARLLAHLAEVDARRLYAPVGYPSMFAYCVEELRFSEDAAAKRIQAARAARRFPELFSALAEGRLHLSAVWLLAPHLTAENIDELIQAATHRKKFEIEALLARRFGSREALVSARIVPVAPASAARHAPGHVDDGPSAPSGAEIAAGLFDEHAPGHVEDEPSPERYLIQVTVSKNAHDLLRRAQELLSHSVPPGDVAQVLERALQTMVVQLEKQKIGSVREQGGPGVATPRRLPRRRSPERSRYIPALTRRAVWERDGGRCTFVGLNGRRCEARRFLQFDHVEPIARGGTTSVHNLRLRCGAHNQYEAERALGEGFMTRKRSEARAARAAARTAAEVDVRERAEAETRAEASEQVQDLVEGLRSLGCRAQEARRAAEFAQMQGSTLADQMRAALAFVARRSLRGCGRVQEHRSVPPGLSGPTDHLTTKNLPVALPSTASSL